MLSPTTSELSAVTELNLENTLNTYTEPPHCINILCAPSMGKGIEDTLNIPELENLLQASW